MNGVKVTTVYSTKEAADQLEVSPGRVRQLRQERGIGQKIGRDWFLTEEEIDSMRDRLKKSGRPYKKAPQSEDQGA